MDLPVIMMSVDGETSRVMKGVQHGACDYLLKPIRMKELKNIWQHVVRKRMHDVRDIEGFECRNDPNDGPYGGDQSLLKKRKDVENKHDERESSDPSSAKKARVVWTVELHQKFVKAVNQIGIDSDKVGPKKILDLMEVPWLTRENVASHLQKYRLYLSRIRKEGETESSFEGMKSMDHSPKESSGSLTLQDSNFGLHNDVSSNYMHPGTQLPIKPKDSKPLDPDVKSSKVLPLRKPFNSEIADPDKTSDLQAGFNQSLRTVKTSIYPWTAEAREMKFEPEFKPSPNSEDCFKFDPPMGPDVLEPTPGIPCGPSISETDNLAFIDSKPINGKQGGYDVIRQLSPIERALLSLSSPDPEPFGCDFEIKHQNSQVLEPNFQIALDMKSQVSCQSSIIDQSSVIGFESTCRSILGLPGEDLMSYWIQNDGGISKDLGFDYVGFSDFKFTEHISEAPAPPCAPKFGLDFDYPFDCVEYPVDQGLTWV